MSSSVDILATAWTRTCSFLGNILEGVCHRLLLRVEKGGLAPNHLIGCISKARLELTISWFLDGCLNPLYQLIPCNIWPLLFIARESRMNYVRVQSLTTVHSRLSLIFYYNKYFENQTCFSLFSQEQATILWYSSPHVWSWKARHSCSDKMADMVEDTGTKHIDQMKITSSFPAISPRNLKIFISPVYYCIFFLGPKVTLLETRYWLIVSHILVF